MRACVREAIGDAQKHKQPVQGTPAIRVYRPRKRHQRGYYSRAQRKNHVHNFAFCSVMNCYLEIRGSEGSMGAINYETHAIGGSGPQFATCNPLSLRLIEACVDIERCALQTLTPAEWGSFFRPLLRGAGLNPPVVTDACLNARAKVGAGFIRMGIFPIRSYLAGSTHENLTGRGRSMPGRADLLQTLRATLQ